MSVAIGTSHFVDRAAANAYYCGTVKTIGPHKVRSGGYGYQPADVEAKIKDGEISIGVPTIPAGATLSVIKDEGRYQYHLSDNPQPEPQAPAKPQAPSREILAASLAAQSDAYTRSYAKLCETAHAYARQAVLDYAAAHPRRRVQFVAAMGMTSFSVKHRGRFAEFSDIEFDGQLGHAGVNNKTTVWNTGAEHRLEQPQFMLDLMDIEAEHGFSPAIAGDLFLEVQGTKILRDLTHW